MTNPYGITAWQGEWGTYEVPARFDPLRIRVNGWPDKRQPALYAEFMAWVDEQERAAAEALSKTDTDRSSHG